MSAIATVILFVTLMAPVLGLECVEGLRAPQCRLLFAGFLTCKAVEGGCITVRPPLRWVRCTTPMVVQVDSEARIDLLGECSPKIDETSVMVPVGGVPVEIPNSRRGQSPGQSLAKTPTTTTTQDCTCPQDAWVGVVDKVVSAFIGIVLTLLTLYIRYRVKRARKTSRRQHHHHRQTLEETPRRMLTRAESTPALVSPFF